VAISSSGFCSALTPSHTSTRHIGSEIWSASSAPVQHAAAYAFGEPAEITGRVA
jgi:aspartate aminotransferase